MSRVLRERRYSPLGPLYTPRVTRFYEKKTLEKFYADNPWPYNTVLKQIASQFNMSFEAVYEWFAKRRARAVGLKSGIVDTIPDKDECPAVMSWQLYVSAFGDEKYRANVIHAFQHPLAPPKLRLESTAWREGLEPPVKVPSRAPAWPPLKPGHAARFGKNYGCHSYSIKSSWD